MKKECPNCNSKLVFHDNIKIDCNGYRSEKNYYCLHCGWPKTMQDYEERIKLKLGS